MHVVKADAHDQAKGLIQDGAYVVRPIDTDAVQCRPAIKVLHHTAVFACPYYSYLPCTPTSTA